MLQQVQAFYSHLDAPHNSHDIALYTHAAYNWLTVHFRFQDFHPSVLDIPLIGQQHFLLGGHFMAFLALLGPLVHLTHSFLSLITAQTLALACTPLLLYHNLSRGEGSRLPAMAVALAFMLDPTVRALYTYDIRPIYFAVPLIVLSFTLLQRGRLGWFAAVAFLACMTKENVFAVYCGLGAAVFFTGRDMLPVARPRLAGAVIGLASLALMLLTVKVLMQGVFSEDFDLLAFKYQYGPRLDAGDLLYLAKLLWPLALLPLFSWRILAAVPIMVQIVLLPDSARDFHVYHSALIMPGLYLAAGDTLLRLERKLRRWLTPPWAGRMLAACCVALLACAALLPSHGDHELGRIADHGYATLSPELAQAQTVAASIPQDASVLTHFRLLPLVAARRNISWNKDLDAGWRALDQDYILFAPDQFTNDGFRSHLERLSREGLCYALQEERHGVFLLRRDTSGKECYRYLRADSLLDKSDGGTLQRDPTDGYLFPALRNTPGRLILPLSRLGGNWSHLLLRGYLRLPCGHLAAFDYDAHEKRRLSELEFTPADPDSDSSALVLHVERRDLRGDALLLELTAQEQADSEFRMRDARILDVHVY